MVEEFQETVEEFQETVEETAEEMEMVLNTGLDCAVVHGTTWGNAVWSPERFFVSHEGHWPKARQLFRVYPMQKRMMKWQLEFELNLFLLCSFCFKYILMLLQPICWLRLVLWLSVLWAWKLQQLTSDIRCCFSPFVDLGWSYGWASCGPGNFNSWHLTSDQ